MCAGVRHESGRRGDSSARGLASEHRWYARLAALLWGSLVSCGRWSMGQQPRLPRTAAVDGAPSGSRAGCQPAPHHASDSTLMSCTRSPQAATKLLAVGSWPLAFLRRLRRYPGTDCWKQTVGEPVESGQLSAPRGASREPTANSSPIKVQEKIADLFHVSSLSETLHGPAALAAVVRDFDRDVVANRKRIGEILQYQTEAFYLTTIEILKRDIDSRAAQYLVTLLVSHNLLFQALCDPALDRTRTVELARQAFRVDPLADIQV